MSAAQNSNRSSLSRSRLTESQPSQAEIWTLEKLASRFSNLQDRLALLTQKQDEYGPLVDLSKQLSAIYKIDTFARAYKKKNLELTRKIDGTNSALNEVKGLLGNYKNKMKDEFDRQIERRDKNSKSVYAHMAQIENSQKKLEALSSSGVKKIQAQLTDEIGTMKKTWFDNLAGLDTSNKACLEGATSKVKTTEEEFKHREAEMSSSITRIEGQFKNVVQKLNDTPNIKKSAIKLTEEEKGSFFFEMQGKIDDQTGRQMRAYDRKFKKLNLEYNQDVLSLRSQMEQVRDWLHEQVQDKQEAPEDQISKILNRVEKVSTHLDEYSESSFKNLDEILHGISEQLANVNKKYTDPNLKEEAQEMITQIDDALVACKSEAKEVEVRVNSDLFKLKELTIQAEEAKAVIARSGETMPPSKRNKLNAENKRLDKLKIENTEIEKRLKRKMSDNKETASTLKTGIYGLTKKLDLPEILLKCMGDSPTKSMAQVETPQTIESPEKVEEEAKAEEEVEEAEEEGEEEESEEEGEEESEEEDS